MPFVKQKKSPDRSVLYSIKAPFELLNADIADIRFFSKSAVDAKYSLLIVDIFTSKIYTYLMKSRNIMLKRLNSLYNDISEKRDTSQIMRLQTDQEFQQVEIKKLNKTFNV